jgi:hypothetical protein
MPVSTVGLVDRELFLRCLLRLKKERVEIFEEIFVLCDEDSLDFCRLWTGLLAAAVVGGNPSVNMALSSS